jgi:AbrB family looped-hinge helix DNA binding protein
METVTISPKYQVVIPKSVREQLHLEPGMKAHVLAYGDRIEFLPVRAARDLRGFLKGKEVEFEREEADRL